MNFLKYINNSTKNTIKFDIYLSLFRNYIKSLAIFNMKRLPEYHRSGQGRASLNGLLARQGFSGVSNYRPGQQAEAKFGRYTETNPAQRRSSQTRKGIGGSE